jgi:hypothetical protein
MSRLEIIRSSELAAAPTGSEEVDAPPAVVERLLRRELQRSGELQTFVYPMPLRERYEAAVGPVGRSIHITPRGWWARQRFQATVRIRPQASGSTRVEWKMGGPWRRRGFDSIAGLGLLTGPVVLASALALFMGKWGGFVIATMAMLPGLGALVLGRRLREVGLRHATQLSEAIHATLAEAESIHAEPGQLSVAEPAEAGGDLALVEADAPRS